MWSVDQHQHYLGACLKCKIWGSVQTYSMGIWTFTRSKCDIWETQFYTIYWFLLLLCQVLRKMIKHSLLWYICLHLFIFQPNQFLFFCILKLSQVHTNLKLLDLPGRSLTSFIIMNWPSLTLELLFAVNSIETIILTC